jgi:FkbM family methyltransferase
MMAAPKYDPNFAASSMHGEFAQHRFLRAVLPHVPKRGMAVDVGAHIGIWTRMLADKFKWVTAFEPELDNFACLETNAGHLKNARLLNVALGAIPSSCSMVLPTGGNSGCWRVRDGGGTEMRTLDSYQLNKVDLIKIDVEGLEGEVIQGARETIACWHPTVVFEENGLGARYYGSNWVSSGTVLTGLRYKRVAVYQKNEIWISS